MGRGASSMFMLLSLSACSYALHAAREELHEPANSEAGPLGGPASLARTVVTNAESAATFVTPGEPNVDRQMQAANDYVLEQTVALAPDTAPFGRTLAAIECSNLPQQTHGGIRSLCLIVDVTGEVVDLNQTADEWHWTISTAPGCEPTESEHRKAGEPTSVEIDFDSDAVKSCAHSSMIAISVQPRKGRSYMLMTQLD